MGVHALHDEHLAIRYSTSECGDIDVFDFHHPEPCSTGKSVRELELENASLRRFIIEGRVVASMMFSQIQLLNRWGESGAQFGQPNIRWEER